MRSRLLLKERLERGIVFTGPKDNVNVEIRTNKIRYLGGGDDDKEILREEEGEGNTTGKEGMITLEELVVIGGETLDGRYDQHRAYREPTAATLQVALIETDPHLEFLSCLFARSFARLPVRPFARSLARFTGKVSRRGSSRVPNHDT